MYPSENHLTQEITTFDGKTHEVTAWKVGGNWNAHAVIDGSFFQSGVARTFELAIGYFQIRYRLRLTHR